jgi:hypothetical protein
MYRRTLELREKDHEPELQVELDRRIWGGPMSAETIPFEIQVECAGRSDGGKKSFEFRHRRDESRGRPICI